MTPETSASPAMLHSAAAVPNSRFRHVPQLDGFRGLAIVLVLAGHTLQFSSLSVFWTGFGEQLSALGVFLFFVLSGYLITGLLVSEKVRTRAVSLKMFYARRVLRLLPALFLFLAVVCVLMKIRLITDVPRYEVLASIFYARNFFGHSYSLAHLWSLSLEEQFYLCWPVAFALLSFKRSHFLAAAGTIAVAVWRGLAMHFHLVTGNEGIYYMRPYFRFDSILIGAWLAMELASNPALISQARSLGQPLISGALWLLLLAWTTFGQQISNPLYLTGQMIVITLLLAQIAVRETGWSARVFRSWPLVYLGKISYSLYLWHALFILTREPSWGFLRAFPINLGVPLLLAITSYHFVERPILRLKDRLSSGTIRLGLANASAPHPLPYDPPAAT
ncbi:MAG TPA: acyltransferase [Candidatus Dormibacteraeota bacterium]|nr:acyltransferase [Candidatus Dormibacteraeota bacterium]